jgi:hypothetical protein
MEIKTGHADAGWTQLTMFWLCRDFTAAGIKFKFHYNRQLVAGMMPNTEDNAWEVPNKSYSREIVTRSYKITEMCHVACGLHLLPCGLPLFTVIFHMQSSPAVSGWNGLNIEFYSIGVSCHVLSRNAMTFYFPCKQSHAYTVFHKLPNKRSKGKQEDAKFLCVL